MVNNRVLIHVGIAIAAGGVVLIIFGYLFSFIPASEVAPGREFLWPIFINTFYIIGIILIPIGIVVLSIGVAKRNK